MIDTMSEILSLTEKREEQVTKVLEKIYSAAQPGAVFGEPVRSGDYTVITASEVLAGGGFGSGTGFGPASPAMKASEEKTSPSEQINAGGGGMGGGGSSRGRPVAIIVIGPTGVSVKPVFDFTKLALAGLTTWGAMLVIFSRMRKAAPRSVLSEKPARGRLAMIGRKR
jgi:uncharacterized spore protein YtfJ